MGNLFLKVNKGVMENDPGFDQGTRIWQIRIMKILYLCFFTRKQAGSLETPLSHSYCAHLRNREDSRAMAFTGCIRDGPLFLFSNHAAFFNADLSRSNSFGVALARVLRHHRKAEQSSQSCSVHRMYWLNRSNIGPGCFPFDLPRERSQ